MTEHPVLPEETRRCGRCGERYNSEFALCDKCREKHRIANRKSYFKGLSSEDLKLREEEQQRKTLELQCHFETSESDCLEWRREFESERRSDFFYNHLDACKLCASWMVKQKKDPLDLNIKGKGKSQYPELDSYAEAFKPSEPFPEDYVHSPYGTFPMTACCSVCGQPLRNGRSSLSFFFCQNAKF